jgi:hypothetical protein
LFKNFLLFIVTTFGTGPAVGGWWTNYEDESWCHRLDDFKYCLPSTFRLERLEDAHLEFIDRSDENISVFAEYFDNETLEETLTDLSVPKDRFYLDGDTHVNGLRIIRYMPNEQTELNHDLMIVFVIFPDDSVVKVFGRRSSQTENSVNAFVEPIPIW